MFIIIKTFLGISEVDQRKIWKYIRSTTASSTVSRVDERDEQDLYNIISIQYILCSDDLFSCDIAETTIDNLDPEKATLCDIISMITSEMGLSDDKAIELFSHEGYPLHHNDITSASKCCLMIVVYIYVKKTIFIFIYSYT